MRPWMGAVAVAAAMLVAPTAALAGPDDPALIQFKLPNEEAHHEFEQLGFNMDHSVEPAGNGAILVSAWVTDEEKALAEAHGYPAVKVIHDKYNIDRIRAEIAADVAREKAAKEALRENAAGVEGQERGAGHGPRAARGLLREQRRPLHLDRGQHDRGPDHLHRPEGGTGCSYTGPDADGRVVRRPEQPDGRAAT